MATRTKKRGPGRPKTGNALDEIVYLRVPKGLGTKLDSRAAILSKETGLRVTRTEYMRRVLVRDVEGQ